MNVLRPQPRSEHAKYCRACNASHRQAKRTQPSSPWRNTTRGHTGPLIYRATSLPHGNLNWENWKACVELLYHSHHKLIHFRALILSFETSLELWLGFQGYTPFFCNASLHHRSCYKQHVTRRKTFRLAEGESTTFQLSQGSYTLKRKLHRTRQIILPRSYLNHTIKIHY